jgi:hypothetical protein
MSDTFIRQPQLSREDRQAIATQFDAASYLRAYPDVAAAGVDPLEHFISHGWREGRNPNNDFDVVYYLTTYPDVAAAGINPLLHYIYAGSTEGRKIKHPTSPWRNALNRAESPRSRAQHWSSGADNSPPLPLSKISALLDMIGVGLVVSFSHDDYGRNIGGVQNVVRNEEQAFVRVGWSYLHVSPAAPLPLLAEPVDAINFCVGLRLNGEWLGIATFEDLIMVVAAVQRRGLPVETIVHHFLGHVPELILELLRVIGSQAIVWIHDFFTVCPSTTLMRNDVEFCAAPKQSSTGCLICCYGDERSLQTRRIYGFFDIARPTVLAPSQIALNQWVALAKLPYTSAVVQPPARLLSAPSAISLQRDPTRPLRIAHIGASALHKGWPVFLDIAMRFSKDERYTFFHLGMGDGSFLPSYICRIPVQVSRADPNAMVEAVAAARIDVVISWSFWPETFCFAVHEALAGGAFLVARSGMGNTPNAIENIPKQGCLIDTENDLYELLQTGGLHTLMKLSPCHRGVLIAGTATCDHVLRRHPSSLFAGAEALNARNFEAVATSDMGKLVHE